MAQYKQSVAYTRMFLMVLSSDHVSPATGKTVTVNLSKAGGAFAAAGGVVTEVSNGWYKIALTTTDTNTLGDLVFDCTATGCDNTDFADQVVAFDPTNANLGLTNVSANVAQWLGVAVTADASNLPNVNVKDYNGTVVSAQPYTGTPPTAAQIATTVWQDLTAGSDFSTAGSIGLLLKTDIDAAISSRGTGTALTATQVENAVWDGLTANHSTAGSFGLLVKTDLDTNIGSRLATSGYTAPPTAAAIATTIFTDLTAGTDFSTAGSFGALVKANLDTNVGSRMATFSLPANFAALGISVGGHISNVDNLVANGDKTGYALTQTFPTNFSTLAITGTGGVTVGGYASGQDPAVRKNQALNAFEFLMVLSSDHVTPATGKTVTAQRSLDGAAFAACANAVTEVGNGIYAINLAAGDLNANFVTLRFSATSCDDSFIFIATQP